MKKARRKCELPWGPFWKQKGDLEGEAACDPASEYWSGRTRGGELM